MNQRKAGTLLSYLHILVSNTISIIYTPYMLQMMGQSEYGLTGTASSFISYLSILSFGIGGAYIRFNTRYRAVNDREGEKQLNGMFLTVFSCLALLVMIGGLGCVALAGKLVEDTFTATELFKLRVILVLLTINMMITFVFNVVMMALQSYEKYFVLRIVALVTSVATPIINIIALKLGGRAIAITAISLAISIVCYIFYFCYARKAIHLEFSFKGFRKDIMKEIFIFSGFLFLNSITDQITFSTDNIVLSAVSGTGAVAVYTVGSHFKNYFQQFSTSISSVFSPSVNLMVAQNQSMQELDSLFVRVGRVQFYVISLVLIGYMSIGESFVRLWAGEDYGDAFYMGLILMLSVCVPSFQNVGLEIQKAFNKHKARSVVYFLVALLNVALTIPFARRWGGIGAAAATLVTTFFGYVVFMNYYYWKRIGLNIPGFWKSIVAILPGLLAPGTVGYLINRFWTLDSFIDILLSALAISVVFGASVWMFSMTPYEKDLLKKPLQKIIRR
jgi:O-antigen/teichoic acid export membrane protein